MEQLKEQTVFIPVHGREKSNGIYTSIDDNVTGSVKKVRGFFLTREEMEVALFKAYKYGALGTQPDRMIIDTLLTWCYLDPDNNKRDPDAPHCSRCKKPLKDPLESAFRIILHPEHPWFRMATLSEKSNAYIGSDCLDLMIRKGGIIRSTPKQTKL
jgi:hypothetical protein